MVLVDSSAWIESMRKNGAIEVRAALQGLLKTYEAQLCSPVRLEVLGGAKIGERKQLESDFSVIPYRRTNERDWKNAVKLGWHLRGHGFSFPWFDILIAAIAIQDKIRLYAIDKHFVKIAELTSLQLYKPGYGGSYQEEEKF